MHANGSLFCTRSCESSLILDMYKKIEVYSVDEYADGIFFWTHACKCKWWTKSNKCRVQFHQSHQLAWQKADCSKYHCTTEQMSLKCVNNYCEETALKLAFMIALLSRNNCWGSKTMWKGCSGPSAQRLNNSTSGMKFFGLTNKSSKSFDQIEVSTCGEELEKELPPLSLYHTNREACKSLCYGVGGICQFQNRGFAPDEGQIE